MLKLLSFRSLASFLPIAIAACSSQIAKSSTKADGFIPVRTVAALDKTGFLQTKIAGKSAIVWRDAADKNTFRALNLTCIHAGSLASTNR